MAFKRRAAMRMMLTTGEVLLSLSTGLVEELVCGL